MRRTIIIIHPGALGDVLLALSAIRAIGAAYPSHTLTLIAPGEAANLLRACQEVHTRHAIEGTLLARILAADEGNDREVEQRLLDCEVAVAWMADPDGRVESVLGKFGVPHRVIASPHSSGCRAIHQTDRFLETVAHLAVCGFGSNPLQLPHAVMAKAEMMLAGIGLSSSFPLVIVHPGSGSRHKCADPGLFAGLLRRFETAGIMPLIVSGPAEGNQVADLQRSFSQPLPVVQNLDLVSMAGVIARADLFVGHDSGLTHLAACLEVPTVALFGPTDPDRWAPRGAHVRIVKGGACRCHEWDTVRACAEKTCLQIPLEDIISACFSMSQRSIRTVI